VIGWLVILLFGGYAGLVALFYLLQDRLLFAPTIGGRSHVATPAAWGMSYRDVWLRAADGARIHGWWLPLDGADGTLLFFHGNAGNISHRLGLARYFQGLGLQVLLVDYRGFGASDGAPSEAGLQRDAAAAWRFLVAEQGLDAERIVLYGRSLGAAVAAHQAAADTPGALILDSSFPSIPRLGRHHYPWLPVRRLARYRFDAAKALRGVRCPVLVLHSRTDRVVPFGLGRAVFDAAREPKAFAELRGGHNASRRQDTAFTEAVQAFVERWRRGL
jgi:hypothetical protein